MIKLMGWKCIIEFPSHIPDEMSKKSKISKPENKQKNYKQQPKKRWWHNLINFWNTEFTLAIHENPEKPNSRQNKKSTRSERPLSTAIWWGGRDGGTEDGINLKSTMLNARSQARRLRATGFHLHDIPEQASPQRQTSGQWSAERGSLLQSGTRGLSGVMEMLYHYCGGVVRLYTFVKFQWIVQIKISKFYFI